MILLYRIPALVAGLLCCQLMSVALGQSAARLRQVFAAGDSTVALRLAEHYRLGTGGAAANADSANWYLKAAATRGEAEAQYLLGVAWLRGMGSTRRVKPGIAMLEKAAAQQNAPACMALGHLYAEGLTGSFIDEKDRVAKSQTRALKWYQTAADLGDAQGAYLTGAAYLAGTGCTRTDSLAVLYMTQAAEKGNYIQAQLTLADWWLNNRTAYGIQLKKALACYQLALRNTNKNPEQTLEADAGSHHVQQLPRLLLNMHWALPLADPEMAPQLRVN